MKHISAHKQSCNTRFLVSALFLSIIVQASIACGFAPQAYSPTALAAALTMNCVNPVPSGGETAAPAPTTPNIVVINEVLSFSQSQWNCAVPTNDVSTQDNAWVEIYNPQDQPYDLYAAHASIDEGPGTEPYWISFGSIIPAHGFLVVFPFSKLLPYAFTQLPPIRLLIDSQVLIDQVTLPDLIPDTSYARIPDGSNNWQITTIPTIGSSNQVPTTQTGTSTSTPNRTTKQKTTQNTHSGGTSNDGTTTDTSSTGVQPTWSALRLPSSASNNLATQQGNSSHSPVSPITPADPFDPLKKILLTLSIVMLFSALLWGWRRHTKRRAIKSRS